MTTREPTTGPEPPDPPAEAETDGPAEPERVVVRDRRRAKSAAGTPAPPPAEPGPSEPDQEDTGPARAGPGRAEPGQAEPGQADPGQAEPEQDLAGGLGAELSVLRSALDERTRDLQRVTAEYANYRKRVERDRTLVNEQATARVLGALLPVLDDLDRARDHGELPEGVAAVVDQLVATTAKFGLTGFGEAGDPFDPNRHEAVAHQTSAEVTEPTCVEVLRRGYLLGDRLLRPAMVAVADPE